ncbi:putative bifunctional diguanylate cyclase/phosphodiesterase [Novosphingobium sp. KACC 22771]|uniref:putative bifunctional diguanylate cyclase/phosphodiesterase n=1 Tax=Novosphingobium sp. KACC 22771 TaxID=3025670 RepID=UPI0023661C06|nr:EAL domain-containing protein [Novosphingobium sp. KACC 22771]WDF72635.1 EAL domain-containing protein [Novosphingobium sp. KACC 22771]
MDSKESPQEAQRRGLLRPINGLVFGAILMLVGATTVTLMRMGKSANDYEYGIISRSWQHNTRQLQAIGQTLVHQDAAAAHLAAGDRRWIDQAILAPMRALSGSGRIVLEPARSMDKGVALRLVGGAGVLSLPVTAQTPEGAPAPYVLRLAADQGMVSTFGSQHGQVHLLLPKGSAPLSGYHLLPLTSPEGQLVATLAWPAINPFKGSETEIPQMLAAIAAAFLLLVWLFMRRSNTIASDLIASEARARHLAFHDTLTGLPNRAMMFDRLGQILALSRRYDGEMAVHCLDLDRFKEVNDTLGHHAGDELIQQVARRLSELCRDSDTVARLGGDEFVILQPEADGAGASHLAARVLKLFETPFELEAGVVEVGVSIGVTLVSNPEIEPAEALRQADLALYGSKENGRNRVTFFEPDMDAALRMRRSLETDLRKALAEGNLTMVYQPQIDGRGTIDAMEALVRWNHPERGSIPPSIFVPLCEESGLILDLGEFVFRRVFEETAGWNDIRVAINVSALQLRSPMFMATLTRLVAEFRVNPERYEIEITETALLGDDGITRDNITMLKQEGFSIALDDFGTGYSSLNSLKRFSVDKIKIDRSFVHNLEANDEAEGLVDAIVKLGRALKLDVVAEGVETEHQRDRLAACGCNTFQGFLVSRPVPASELQGLFSGHNP